MDIRCPCEFFCEFFDAFRMCSFEGIKCRFKRYLNEFTRTKIFQTTFWQRPLVADGIWARQRCHVLVSLADLKTVRLLEKNILCVLLTVLSGCFQMAAAPSDSPPNTNAAGSAHWSQLKPYTGQADAFTETPELIKLGPGSPVVAPTEDGQAKLIPVKYFHRSSKAKGNPSERDPVIQSSSPVPGTPSPTTGFEGINNIDGYVPPDTVGAIGPSNYVQAVNVRVQVFNRFTGASQTSAALVSSLFASLGSGSLCASTDDGDVIVVYDQYADRWWVSQFANASSTTGPFYMSIAVSKTSDPTGAYYAYCFQMPGNLFPDYPKVGVWGDAYYMSANQFNATGTAYEGAGVYAFDRRKMLAGDPSASFIYFNVGTIDANVFGLQPSNADGPLPPIGTPNYFVYLRGLSLGDPSNDLRIFQFHADFANTSLATFTERSDSPVAVAAYTAFNPDTPGIPQSGTATNLDTLADRLMFRLQYRNFGTNESLVVNHTVTGGSGQAGVRYYQLTRSLPGGSFGINEQATYAPDSLNRWMGSAAMNYQGDLAVGYNVSSGSTFPSIRYAARLNTDPHGGLFQGEATLVTGSGTQTGAYRWGDYSCMTIDPSDDSTFWYTQEYYAKTSQAGWQTRIGSFALPNSAPAPRASIQGTVTRVGSGIPLPNVVVRSTNGYIRFTDANGAYSMNVTPGTYDLSAQLAGVGSNTVAGLILTNGQVLTQNFVLGSLVPQIETNSYSFAAGNCGNGAINPGEVVTLNLSLQNVGTSDTSNLVVTLESSNGVAFAVAPQTYGVLSTNGTPVSQSFTFIVTGACGGSIAPVFQLQDGAANLGSITLNFPLGARDTNYSENFDEVAAPALPAGWTTTASGAQSLWVTSTAASDTAPNSAFATDANNVGLNELISPSIAIPSAPTELSFRNFYDTESGNDGGVLEIAIAGGAFTDIISAGGSFVAGPYNGKLSTIFHNPLAGRSAWTGYSGGFTNTIVNLPAAALGHTVQFKWRCGSDSSVSSPGWWIDSISISGVTCCLVPTPPLLDSLSISNNQFGFALLGTSGSNYVLQASTNLASSNWVSLKTNPAPFSFAETNVMAFPQRFYRGLIVP